MKDFDLLKSLFGEIEISMLNRVSHLSPRFFTDSLGNTFLIPEKDTGILPHLKKDRVWEKDLVNYYSSILNTDDKVLVVGANFGYHVVNTSRIVGSSGRVSSIEPVGDLITLCRINCSINFCDNVDFWEFAASDVDGVSDIYLSPSNIGDNTLVNSNFYLKANYKVVTKKLDDFFVKEIFDFVILDVQGWEPKVLSGMFELIERSKCAIAFEVESANLTLFEALYLDVVKRLSQLGYIFKNAKGEPISEIINFLETFKNQGEVGFMIIAEVQF